MPDNWCGLAMGGLHPWGGTGLFLARNRAFLGSFQESTRKAKWGLRYALAGPKPGVPHRPAPMPDNYFEPLLQGLHVPEVLWLI